MTPRLFAPRTADSGLPAITLRDAYFRYLHDQPPVKKRTIQERLTALKHWEELTGNTPLPLPVGDETIDRERHVAFRAHMQRAQCTLAERVATTTVNKYFHRTLNSLFRRLSPESYENPDGVGLVTRVYKFSKLAEDPEPPRPMSAAEVDACYRTCDFARWPRATHRWRGYGIPPGDWWRAVIVFEYNVGQRTGDFLGLRCSQVDLADGTLTFRAEKTSSSKGRRTVPLHPVVVEHLKRIWPCTHGFGDRDLVFPAPKTKRSRKQAWETIQQWARIERPFYRLKDLRATCGTELYDLSPGAAKEMLGHSSITTTDRNYANLRRHRRLAKHVEGRPQPAAFSENAPQDEPPRLQLFG